MPSSTSKNGWRNTALAVSLTILAAAVGALFYSWNGNTEACMAKAEHADEATHALDNRVGKVETNIENIDETLKSMDGKLDKALQR
jgi:anti-sigma-K factor RskA